MFLPLTVASIGSITALACLLRARRLRLLREKLQKPLADLPPELEASWKQHRIWKFASKHSVILGTGAFTTAQALFHLNRMDGQVFDAIDTIYKPGIENSFSDIVSHLRDLDGASTGAWDGAVAAYKGRLGEEYMAEYLSAAGHHVEFAASTNQAGWDALVDGQAVNFKAGTEVGHIQEHLDKYPEIPVITVAEQGESFADNAMVTCLTGVSGQEIEQTTEAAMESVVDLTDFAMDIPLVTLAFATAKNFKPAFSGHSDLTTAAVNTATDTAGVGIGAAAGAKAGALAGALAGPIGAVAGSIIGGLAGAMTGRSIARGFKEKDLRAAQADYDSAVTDYGHAYANALRAKANQLEATAQSMERSHTLWRFWRPRPSDLIREDMQAAYLNWAQHCRKLATQHTEGAAQETQADDVYKAVGDQLLRDGPLEPVYHKRIERAIARIRETIQHVTDEQRRLGYA